MDQLIYFVLEVGLGVVAIACLLRFLFQLAQVNLLNIVVASTRRITDVVLNPVRTFMPRSRYVDTASLFVAWVAMAGRVAAQYTFEGSALGFILASLWLSLIKLLQFSIWVFIVAIFANVVLSWVAPTSTSPYAQLARELPNFLLRPVRSILPSLGGLDFSPAIVLFALFAINSRVIPLLSGLFFQT